MQAASFSPTYYQTAPAPGHQLYPSVYGSHAYGGTSHPDSANPATPWEVPHPHLSDEQLAAGFAAPGLPGPVGLMPTGGKQQGRQPGPEALMALQSMVSLTLEDAEDPYLAVSVRVARASWGGS